MKRKGCGSCKYTGTQVYYFCEERQREIRDLVSAGFDTTLQAFRRDDLMHNNRFSQPYEYHHANSFQRARKKEIWDRSSFEFLVSTGFDLDPDDFILPDPKDEPFVLRKINEADEAEARSKEWVDEWMAARQITAA